MFSSFFYTKPSPIYSSNFALTDIYSPLFPLLEKLENKEKELLAYVPNINDEEYENTYSLEEKKYLAISYLNEKINLRIKEFNKLPEEISLQDKRNLVIDLMRIIISVKDSDIDLWNTLRTTKKQSAKAALGLSVILTTLGVEIAAIPASFLLMLWSIPLGLAGGAAVTYAAGNAMDYTLKSIDENIKIEPETLGTFNTLLETLQKIDLELMSQQPSCRW